MKVKGVARAAGLGAAEGVVQKKPERSPAAGGRGRRRRWNQTQGVELSRLVLGFARRHKRLPDVGDRPFWDFCDNRFRGFFTRKQVQAKARYLYLRFRRLATGAAKTLHLMERQTLQIWTHVIQHVSAGVPSPSSSTSSFSRSLYTSSPPSSPASYAEESMNSGDHQEDSACNKQTPPRAHSGGPIWRAAARINGLGGRAKAKPAGVGPANIGANASGAAAGGYERQEASTCSTGNINDEEPGFHSEGNAPQNNAASDNAARDNNEDTAHNFVLMHHITVLDLAAAVKTLAEVVAHGPMA